MNKKDYSKKWAVKWTKGKRTQIMRWKYDNLQIFTFLLYRVLVHHHHQILEGLVGLG